MQGIMDPSPLCVSLWAIQLKRFPCGCDILYALDCAYCWGCKLKQFIQAEIHI